MFFAGVVYIYQEGDLTLLIEVLTMTLNKYFVFIPTDMDQETHKEQKVNSDMETQRQALVKQAQQEGGL